MPTLTSIPEALAAETLARVRIARGGGPQHLTGADMDYIRRTAHEDARAVVGALDAARWLTCPATDDELWQPVAGRENPLRRLLRRDTGGQP